MHRRTGNIAADHRLFAVDIDSPDSAANSMASTGEFLATV
jgi:hypothetical protein